MKTLYSLRVAPLLLATILTTLFLSANVSHAATSSSSKQTPTHDEFSGPFPSWANLRKAYAAVGDGQADDTNALQTALNELGSPGHAVVLYLPAGTYRITRGLTMTSHMNVSILGEQPSNTIIKYDGPKGGTMLYCNGVRYSRFGRITWDGNSQAETAISHKWDGHTPNANSHNEHADEIFQNVGFGIRAGVPHFMDAECAVIRCRFYRCAQAGVSIESFNALDWWIRDCYFEDCHYGVTNTYGAGHFHVYDSVFIRSTEADCAMQNTSYFSVRHNVSIGSKAFFIAGWIGSGAPITLQGNTIIDPTGTEVIRIGCLGPALLVDNIIAKGADAAGAKPIVVNRGDTTTAVGNSWGSEDAITVASKDTGAPLLLDNKVVAHGAIAMPSTGPTQFALNLHRQVTDVAPGANAATIQAAIDAAAQEKTARLIVHLPAGQYAIDHTLVIPAGSDLQLVGDDWATVLKWSGTTPAPVLRLAGPSRATLRNFYIDASNATTGLLIEKCDQPGARVFMEQGEVANAAGPGLLVDGLDNTEVTLKDFYHSGVKGPTGVAVKVIGGPRLAAGGAASSRTAILGGASSDSILSYDIQRNARLIAEDIWYESGSQPGFIDLNPNSSGTFTLNGGMVATAPPKDITDPTRPGAILVNGFRGKLALLQVNSNPIIIAGSSPDAQVLAVVQGNDPNNREFFINKSGHATALLTHSTIAEKSGGAFAFPDRGTAQPQFIRAMLAQMRAETPHPLTPLQPGVTDVRAYRVTVSGGANSIRLAP